MEETTNVLERKWKLIKHTFDYADRVGLAELFADYLDFIKDKPELGGIIDNLQGRGLIPKDIFLDWDGVRSWKKEESVLSDAIRDNFHQLHKLHTCLINEIYAISVEKNESKNETKKIFFDQERSRLHIRGKKIKIQKFSDQYHALRIIFCEPNETSKEWFFSEIAERAGDGTLTVNHNKKYYNATYQIRKKLAMEGFPEFFVSTRQSVKINLSYLS